MQILVRKKLMESRPGSWSETENGADFGLSYEELYISVKINLIETVD